MKNVYEISSFIPSEEESEELFTELYVVHEKSFTQEEFTTICNEAMKNILDRTAYELERYLIINYGFRPLDPNIKFEFEEECENMPVFNITEDFHFSRIDRTSTSECYNIFDKNRTKLAAVLDVHFLPKGTVNCRVVILINKTNSNYIVQLKDSIYNYFESVIQPKDENGEEDEIVFDIYTGTHYGLYSSKSECVLK